MQGKSSAVTIDHFMPKKNVLSAEVLWVLKAVAFHYSYKSSNGIGELFSKIFPGCPVAEGFSYSESKCARLARFGLAPYFKCLLVESVNGQENFVLLFDESPNFENQKKQLDIHVRAWEMDIVSTHYFGSEFIGHGNAENLVNHVCKALSRLHFAKLVQISVDGPNVNWKFNKEISQQIEVDFNNLLVDIGSCGLHILHGAFKTAMEKSKLFGAFESLYNSAFWLFKDSPARREDFEKVCGSSLYPIQFCKHRWLENLPVAQRFLKVWENIKKYVKTVIKKEVAERKCKSFSVVKDRVADEMVIPMTHFYITVIQDIHPFLERYQCDKPMLPFLVQDLFAVLRALMQRFIKSDAVRGLTTQYKLMKFNVKDKDNYCGVKKVGMSCGGCIVFCLCLLPQHVLKSVGTTKTVKGFYKIAVTSRAMDC